MKRFTGVEVQATFEDKEFSITHFSDGVGLYSGDSGGPLYVKLPDHTWRLIGVNHSSISDFISEVQSVPPYLGWIEWDVERYIEAGLDITPCHARVPGTSDYVFTGGCEGILALDPGVEEDWTDGCGVTLGGPSDAGVDECSEWPIGQTSTFLAPSL